MECYKCGRTPIENNLSMVAIDPPGKDRRWSCTECTSNKQIDAIPGDIVELCKIIDPNFLKAEV